MAGFTYSDEKQLLLLISQGDEAAFEYLFKKHYPKVYSVAFMFCHSDIQSQEVVQDVFLKVWLNRAKIAEIEDWNNWLYIITRNETFTAMKKSIRFQQIVTDMQKEVGEEHENVFERIVFEDYYAIAQQAINALPLQQRTAYKLAKEEGLSREQVAEKMNIRPDTVKEYLAIAKKAITKHLIKNKILLPVIFYACYAFIKCCIES